MWSKFHRERLTIESGSEMRKREDTRKKGPISMIPSIPVSRGNFSGQRVYLDEEVEWLPKVWRCLSRRTEESREFECTGLKSRKRASSRIPLLVQRVVCRHPVEHRPATTSGIELPYAPGTETDGGVTRGAKKFIYHIFLPRSSLAKI